MRPYTRWLRASLRDIDSAIERLNAAHDEKETAVVEAALAELRDARALVIHELEQEGK